MNYQKIVFPQQVFFLQFSTVTISYYRSSNNSSRSTMGNIPKQK